MATSPHLRTPHEWDDRAPSPRRHSFASSPTATGFAEGEEEERRETKGKKRESSAMLSPPSYHPLQLSPVPHRTPTSRLRAPSHSAPRPRSLLPTGAHAVAMSTTQSADQWASRRAPPMSEVGSRVDGWKAVASSPVDDGPDSPMDRFPLEYRSRALPPPPHKFTSPLSPIPPDEEADTPPHSAPFAHPSPRATPSLADERTDERRFSNRTLSPAALAALADTPPRPTPMMRPSVPTKSSARLSQTSRDSGMFEAEVFGGSRSRSASSSSTGGSRLASLIAPPTVPLLTNASPILAFAHPRLRDPSTRTPVLSLAGSSSSRASSSVFTPSSSSAATSSGHSRDGTDWGRVSFAGSEQVVVEEEEEMKGGTIGRSKRLTTALRLDRSDSSALGFGLGGLGIAGFGGERLGDDGDLQRGLEELALYARSLPSPLPRTESQEPEDDRTMIFRPPTSQPLPLDGSRRPSLAASSRTSASSHSSRRPSTRHSSDTPPSSSPNLPRIARRRSIREPFEASESELSVDESGIDDLTTDDEEVGYSRHYLAFGEKEGGSPGSFFYPGSATVGVREGWGAGEDEEVLCAETENKGVLDRSGTSVEGLQVGPKTTHLILARTTTPQHVAGLLRRVVPTLSFGLVVLDISYCGLVEVPFAIASCRTLEELDIKGNPLATGVLPSFFGSLLSLRVLVADSCGLTELPYSLAPLKELHTLSIRHNGLHALPSWLCRLGGLEMLLVDGNDFHWQWANLVQPLLLRVNLSGTSLAEDDASVRSLVAASLTSVPEGEGEYRAPLVSAHSAAELRSKASSSSLHQGSSPPKFSTSILIPDSSAPPSPHSFSTPPPFTAPHIDISEAQARLRHQSDRPSSSTPSTAPTSPTIAEPVESSRKWGKMFKKVSMKGMRPNSSSAPAPGRPGALVEGSRTFSEPVTSAESTTAETKTGSRIFRSRLLTRATKYPPPPLALSTSERRLSKRRSFLQLEQVPTLGVMISNSPLPADMSSPAPPDHKAGLRSVMAYLRDLDDLTTEPPPPPSTPTSSPPPLRHSPSLGDLAPPTSPTLAIRRAQSTRRLPSNSARANSSLLLSQYSEDDPSGRGTPLANEPPLPQRLRCDPAKRDLVVREIIETEKSYLKGLQELCSIYIATAAMPYSSSSGKKDTVVPASERRAVFGDVEAIREFHQQILLPDLIAATESGESAAAIAHAVARIFIQHSAVLKIYSSYVNSFDAALARLQTWTMESRPTNGTVTPARTSPNPSILLYDPSVAIISTLSTNQRKRIKSYLKRCRANPAHSQISLESYLLLPVQRVPRYRMLLESLQSCTPFDDSALVLEPHPVIKEAAELISAVALDMNERKRESEGRQQLLYWQQRIGMKFRSPLVQPHRSLLRSGTFTLIRAVKRSSTFVDSRSPRTGLSDTEPSKVLQIHSLHTEAEPQTLIALLCTDILVFLKEPVDPTDISGPVDLYTVLRLTSIAGSVAKPPPASLFGADNTVIRIACDTRAILYVQSGRRSEAVSWMTAINLQQALNA